MKQIHFTSNIKINNHATAIKYKTLARILIRILARVLYQNKSQPGVIDVHQFKYTVVLVHPSAALKALL